MPKVNQVLAQALVEVRGTNPAQPRQPRRVIGRQIQGKRAYKLPEFRLQDLHFCSTG